MTDAPKIATPLAGVSPRELADIAADALPQSVAAAAAGAPAPSPRMR